MVSSVMPWKPVRKLIIPLRVDDSSTTDFEDETDEFGEMGKNSETNAFASRGMSAEALRAFDNASPASIAMDTPTMAPCSPIDGENLLLAANDVNAELAKDPTNTNDTFQVKLDEYLKQVRAKTDSTQEVLSSNASVVKPAVPQKTEKKTIISLKQKTPVVGSSSMELALSRSFRIFNTYIFSFIFILFTGCVPFANIGATRIPSIDKSNQNIGKAKGTEIVSIQTAKNATKFDNNRTRINERYCIR